MSSAEQPRLRSLAGLASPCTKGPMAAASPSRSTILTAMLAEVRSGKIRVLARPATVEPGAFEAPTAGDQRGVGLQLAVHVQFRGARADDAQRLDDLVHFLVPAAAALGGVAEQGHDRLGFEEQSGRCRRS